MNYIRVKQGKDGRSYELPSKRKRGHRNKPNTREQGEAEWRMLEVIAEQQAANRRRAAAHKIWKRRLTFITVCVTLVLAIVIGATSK